MAVAVIELENDIDLARNASVQLEEMGFSSEVFAVDQLMDLPGEVANRLEDFEAVVVLADMTDSEYVSEAVSQIIRIDSGSDKPVAKVLDEKRVRDRHTYHREMKSLASQRAEELTRDLKNQDSAME
ncbi:hypothetical protein [Candidatus Nanohalovita haloferacivicina]|uniref:hypothetical protein n=1 Tax=Candidatus Nanohalovita haloferacivicina TaxID=2978046 RepID=UPI00325FD954|nr:hypothetical protein HBNXNv_0786 [Candidatus Nanohalobia archaeon BNXNv]